MSDLPLTAKKSSNGKETESKDLKFGSGDEDYLKSTDLSLALGAGLLFKNYEIRVGISNSISNLEPDKDSKHEIYNRVFSISAGYRFGP